MRNTSNRIVAVAAAALLTFACQESFDDRLVRESHDQTRRNCPRRIDRGTILDSITYTPSTHEWCYCYTLVDSLDCDDVLDPELLADFHDRLSFSVANDLSMRQLKAKGITIVYSYRRASSREEVIRETFTPEDY